MEDPEGKACVWGFWRDHRRAGTFEIPKRNSLTGSKNRFGCRQGLRECQVRPRTHSGPCPQRCLFNSSQCPAGPRLGLEDGPLAKRGRDSVFFLDPQKGGAFIGAPPIDPGMEKEPQCLRFCSPRAPRAPESPQPSRSARLLQAQVYIQPRCRPQQTQSERHTGVAPRSLAPHLLTRALPGVFRTPSVQYALPCLRRATAALLLN